jgi:deoxyribodipyrimidine photolyase
MDTAIVVFTRDLRLHDNPALHQAYVRARQVVPLFVVDPALGTRSANRGEYVRRYVPELAGLDPAWIRTPWKLPPAQRVRLGYPGLLAELA